MAALRRGGQRYRGALLFASGVAAAGLVWLAQSLSAPEPFRLTQQDIDDAVLHTLANARLPSRAARAAEIIAPTVVRVHQIEDDSEADKEAAAPRADPPAATPDSSPRAEKPEASPSDRNRADASKPGAEKPDAEKPRRESRAVGTGVVILEEGVILTNLHVVAGSKRIGVTFANGFETEATVIGVQAENDLAVIRARTVPDDLVAATMRSTSDLRPGDEVVAVGFPFGIGPSVSSGVVSGLRREFQSADGEKLISNLIQFDAAANPGNSGGPLVTMEGEVVGIVTSILNPTEQRVFIGIGFAVPIENAASAVGMVPF